MKILHPTDFSEGADQALAAAIRLARALGAEVHLLHVFVEPVLFGEGLMRVQEVDRVFGARRRWAAKALETRAAEVQAAGVQARGLIRTGGPSEEIVRTAKEQDADLIVLGTHGRTGLGRLLVGSVADRVVRTAPCPVVTVRESGMGDGEKDRPLA